MELLSGVERARGLFLPMKALRTHSTGELGMEPSAPLQELAARLRGGGRAEASLGATLYTPTATSALSVFEIPLVGRRRSLGRSSPSTTPPAKGKCAWWPSWGRRG